MPSNADLDEARAAAQEIHHEVEWRNFARFCDLRSRGLRKAALDMARHFVNQARLWPYEERHRFSAWLAERATQTTIEIDGRIHTLGVLLPQPVLDGLVRPTLREWREQEPGNAAPHLWSALLHDLSQDDSQEQLLRRALAADPQCERARMHLVNMLTGYVEDQQHHLPDNYLGDPQVGLAYLEEARRLLARVQDEVWRRETGERLGFLERLTRDWMQFREEAGEDFQRWCEEHGRSHPRTRTYGYR